jgi:hypothetical protein
MVPAQPAPRPPRLTSVAVDEPFRDREHSALASGRVAGNSTRALGAIENRPVGRLASAGSGRLPTTPRPVRPRPRSIASASLPHKPSWDAANVPHRAWYRRSA